MEYALVGLASLALYGWGWWARRRRGRPIDHAFASILVFMSVAVGSAMVALFVAVWVIASAALHPGTPVEANMPPGFNGKFLFAIVIFGAPLSLIWAAAEYRRHLDT